MSGFTVTLAHYSIEGQRVHDVQVNGMPVMAATDDAEKASAIATRTVDDYRLGRIAGVGVRKVDFVEWDGDKGSFIV